MQALKLNDLCLNHKLPEEQRLAVEASIKRLCKEATVLPERDADPGLQAQTYR